MNHCQSEIDCTVFSSALIVGKNKNNDRISNGVGKTTIYNAIEYALFNKVPTTTLDKIVKDGAKRCKVEWDFEVPQGTFRVVRGRSAKGKSELFLYEYVNGTWEDISQRTMPETEDKIKSIIKISHKAFHHSIRFSQMDVSGLATSDKEDRLSILKEPLNLSKYTKLEKIAQERAKPIKKDIERTDASIVMLGNPDTDISAAELEIEACKTKITENESKLSAIKIDLENKRQHESELKSTLTSTDSEIHNKINNLEQTIRQLKLSISKSETGCNSSRSKIKESEGALDSLNKIIVSINVELSELLSQPAIDKEKLKQDIKKVSDDEILGTQLLSRHEADYDHASRLILKGDVCSSCFQPITKEHKEKCAAEAEKTMQEKSESIQKTKDALAKCRKKKQRLQEQLEQLTITERKIENLQRNKDSNEKQLIIHTKHLDDNKKQLTLHEQELEQNKNLLSETIKQHESLKETAQNSSVADLNNKIFAIRDEIKELERKDNQLIQEISAFKTKEGALTERIATRTADKQKLDDLKLELKRLNKELEIHQRVINAFGYNGIPTFIISTVLDELQLATNTELQKLRPGLQIQFTADLDMKFTYLNQERDWQQLSVGQQVYIALSLKLGLSKVIQKKLGISIEFLLLDEVDQSLDEAGVDAFCNVVKNWQQEVKVFIISHNKSVKERMHHAILVESDDLNGSSAHVTTSW